VLDASLPSDATELSHWHVQKEAGGNAPHGPVGAAVTAGYNKTLLSSPYSSDAQDDTRDDVMWLCLEGRNATIYGGIESSAWVTISVIRPLTGFPIGASIAMGLASVSSISKSGSSSRGRVCH
jgi:hypothetical protein